MPASPRGTRFTYVGTWNGVMQILTPPQDFSAQVADSLRTDYLVVEDTTVSDPGVFTLNGKGTITFKVRDDIGHADLDDARRVIDHEFYIASGKLPDASRITDYALPLPNGGNQQSQGTGAPPAPPDDGTGTTGKNCTNWLGLPTDCATTSGNVAKTAGYVALAVVAGVLGLAIFKFGGLVKPAGA